VNFFKRKSDGTLNAKVQLKTASGKFIQTHSNSACEVIDWNNDGLLDILISSEYAKYDGGAVVKLFLNKGSATSYSFADSVNMKTSDGKDISLYERTNICVADLNYDGKKDLILGDGIGDYNGWQCNVYFFENIGTNGSPSLKIPVKLKNTNNTDIKIQYDLKPYITDWNEDGGLDLLLGHMNAEVGIDIYLGEKPPTPILNSNSVKPAVRKYTLQSGFYRTELYLNNQENILFQVLSVNGRMVESVNLGNLPAGANSIRHDMNKYPTGCYVIRVLAGEKSINENRLLLFKN